MAQNKKNTNVATNNTATNKEEIVMRELTKNDIRMMLEVAGVTMTNAQFKKTKKDELLSLLEEHIEPAEEIIVEEDTVSVGDLEITKDNAPAFEEPVVEEKKEDNAKMRNRRLLLNLLCYRWVAESRLFFKSNKYKEKGGDYFFIASRKRQLGVTCKVLKDLGWQANPATLDRVAEILREEGMVVSATRDVYIPSAIWQKFVNGKEFFDRKKGDKDIITYLKEVIK